MIIGPPSGSTVLAVDDDQHTRHLLRDLCESLGYRVRTASDGEEALESVAQGAPDILLLDLMMPKRDGFSVLRALRESPPTERLPVIVLTAMGDMDGKIRAMELGADDYVTKPFKLFELQARITAALQVHHYRLRLSAAEEELNELRALDPVTGVGTYAQLKSSLDQELARSSRYAHPLGLLLLGIEDYQGIRYQLGREGCDDWVRALTGHLRQALRTVDRIFRLDSDEFVILLPETGPEGANTVAGRIIERIGSEELEGRDGPLRPRVRIGGSIYPGQGEPSSEDILRRALQRYRNISNSPERIEIENEADAKTAAAASEAAQPPEQPRR